MYSTTIALALALCFLNFAIVDAAIYVVRPARGSTCHGGKKCTIEWLDDGSRPLLSAIGMCTFGLYTGKQQLIQTIQPTDVSEAHAVVFTPNPGAGPNSDAYYIGIISKTLKGNESLPYAAFSPFFQIDQMTGSFDTPLASATAAIPILSSNLPSTTSSSAATSTVPPSTGTSSFSKSVASSSIRLTTVRSSSVSTSPTSTSPAPSTATKSDGSAAPASTSAPSSAYHVTANLVVLVPLLVSALWSGLFPFL